MLIFEEKKKFDMITHHCKSLRRCLWTCIWRDCILQSSFAWLLLLQSFQTQHGSQCHWRPSCKLSFSEKLIGYVWAQLRSWNEWVCSFSVGLVTHTDKSKCCLSNVLGATHQMFWRKKEKVKSKMNQREKKTGKKGRKKNVW